MDPVVVATIAAVVASLSAATSTIFAWRSSVASRRSAESSARESALRTRPWIFIDDVKFLSASSIGFNVKNIGEMPGLNLTLDISGLIEALSDTMGIEGEFENIIGGSGAVFPSASYMFQSDIRRDWVSSLPMSGKSLDFKCSLEYSFGESGPFTTIFQIKAGPATRETAPDAVPLLFSNIGAS